jgi:hypothetical protein
MRSEKSEGAGDAAEGGVAPPAPARLHWMKQLLLGRRGSFLLLLYIVVVTIGSGCLSYYMLHSAETRHFSIQYHSLAEHALRTISSKASDRTLVAKTLAGVVAAAKPNRSEWPHVYIDDFGATMDHILGNYQKPGTVRQAVGYAPLFVPDQVEASEDYALARYKADPNMAA